MCLLKCQPREDTGLSLRCQPPKGSAVCDLLEGQANTRGSGEMWREGQEGHLQTRECSAEGAEGMESGREARRAHQLSGPATGHTSVPLHTAGGNLTRGGLSPGKREEGDIGQGALLGGAKYLGRPAWHPPSPGSPGAAAGRGWPASGREWVQEEGHGQEAEVKSPPTRHPL